MSLADALNCLVLIVTCVSASPPGGGGYNSGQNSMANPRSNPCDYLRCQNGGYCDTLYSDRPHCVCPAGYTGPSCQYSNQDRNESPCDNFRCENGGRCSIDRQSRPSCQCSRGYSGSRCETREGPPQSITHLRCDSACSTATSCRICLPCDTCQYQTLCLAYEILVKSLDAECHAQGYQEALLMKSLDSPLGYSPIKCRGSGPTRECPQGSSCVDDGKGGATCCRNRVGREALENKQGSCPANPVVQTCGRLSCQGDIDCAGNLKCCARCGNKCTNPDSRPSIPDDRNRDPCQNVRCLNGGRCAAPADAPFCECPKGYTGSRCENIENPCQNYNCQNGGRCTSRGNVPSCECPSGYTGPQCQNRDNPCQGFVCLNGGRCFIDRGEPACQCLRDYRGPRCGIRDDPCQTLRCENGGRCVTQGDEPMCVCPSGFRGPRCGSRDVPANPCQDVRCQNGGRCALQGTSAYCQCPRGYSGPQCESGVPANPCQDVRCQNGGRCALQGTSAYCQCPRGYSGPRCESGAVQPTSNPCQIFGNCNDRSSDQCGGCPSGWVCQYISTGCPTLNCGPPTYRCVSKYKK